MQDRDQTLCRKWLMTSRMIDGTLVVYETSPVRQLLRL
ncbi:hypothetical protein SP19_86 [Salmonella phage 19]|nr:hypothetical protein SP19_86 [Salmonella phage 19]